jgi:subtilisin family serine protease
VTKLKIFLLCSLFAAGAAWSGDTSRVREVSGVAGIQLAGAEDELAPKVYIVQLKTPSAAEYHASMANAVANTYGVRAPASKLAKTNPAILSYAQMLDAEQERILASVGSNVERIYSYRYSLNGFAARMSVADAHKLENRGDVLFVWEDEVRPLTTTYSRSFLGLFDREDGLRSVAGLDGGGVVIGVIDSGITPEHLALRDTRESDRPRLCRSSWGKSTLLGLWLCRRYTQLPDVLVFETPENWNGICQAGSEFTADDCNNKLIGARYFVAGAQASGALDDGEFLSARDADGHGTHTATTAAGNRVQASMFGSFFGSVEGMAPKARIAVYKACWLRPGDTRASCNTSDLANAIDTAVADGVDIINYSVGSTLLTGLAPDDLAFMAAAKAGVLSVVAAGNDGPNLGTIASPAGGPWVITAAASSREGQSSREALQVDAPANVAGKYAVREAGFTPSLRDRDPLEGELVLIDDDDTSLEDGSTGTIYDGCQLIVNSSDVLDNIAFIQRGGCSFQTKLENAEEAGAIAAVVFNIAGAPIVMTGTPESVDIPALMIGQADGNLLRDEIDDSQIIEVVLDKSFFLTEDDTGNVMGIFSSRGPGPIEDILKPDVTAPGINILAGNSPDAANSVAGENFSSRSGTSMSTPHVAGVAALLKQAHPDWAPAEIKSALMTTAYQDVDDEDGVTPANPFDFGSGHIDANKANDPGLVYDIKDDEYDAFACGIASPAVDQARCDQLHDAGLSHLGPDLNQPSISVARLTSTRTVSRRVVNVSDESDTYVAQIVSPPGIDVSVNPPTLMVGPGQTATYDVTLNYLSGPMNLWRFGSLTWAGNDHDVRSVLATRPVPLTAPQEVSSFGGTGSLTFPVQFGYTGTYTPGVHGLRSAAIFPGQVDEDAGKSFSFRDNNGVSVHLLGVSTNQAYVRFALSDEFTDGNDDLDMYVYYSANGVDFTEVGKSGSLTSEEQVSFLLPPSGTYAVLIHGFDTDDVVGGPGSEYELRAWEFGLNDNIGNMTSTGPGPVTSGSTRDVTIDWSNLDADSDYLGGISHNTPDGLVSITIVSIRN